MLKNPKTTIVVWLIIWACFAAIGVKQAHAQDLKDCNPITTEYRQGVIGKHIIFVCAKKDRSDVFEWSYYCKHSEPFCSDSAFFRRVGPIGWAKAPLTVLAATFTPEYNCKNPPDEYKDLCAEHKAIVNEEWGTWTKDFIPVKYVYKVKPNGTQTTRPGYTLVNGVVGTKEVARAPVGALCRMDTPTSPASGTDIRAQWADGPAGVVTICSKGAQ